MSKQTLILSAIAFGVTLQLGTALAAPQETVFKLPLWMLAIPLAVALFSLIGSIPLLRSDAYKALGFILIGIAIMAGGLFFPAMMNDRVMVTPERIEQSTGLWFAPITKGFSYARVQNVRIERWRVGIRKRRTQEVWVLTYNSGRTEVIDPGDLWAMNTSEIIGLLREYGVDIQ